MANEGINGQEAKRRTGEERRRKSKEDRDNRKEARKREERDREEERMDKARGLSWARVVRGKEQDREDLYEGKEIHRRGKEDRNKKGDKRRKEVAIEDREEREQRQDKKEEGKKE